MVYRAAAEIQTYFEVPKNGTCAVLDTIRVYSPEAIDIFGVGYVALQMHVTHIVYAISQASVALQQVRDLVSSGFQITTGGQRLFLNCLNQYSNFSDVLEVKLKRGLSDDFPSTAPTQPTKTPVTSPQQNSTVVPTMMPTLPQAANPTEASTGSSSSTPSRMPSSEQRTTPSNTLGEMPSQQGMHPITPLPNGGENLPYNSTQGQDRSTDQTTAIGGAVAIFLVTTFCIYGMWRRTVQRRKRSKPGFALTSKDGQLSIADPNDLIPGFVNLDQRSLAETSLGEQTAGDVRMVHKPLTVRQTASFDEDSLYTSTFATRHEDTIAYHQTQHGQFARARQVKIDGECDRKTSYPISDIEATYASSTDPPSSPYASSPVASYNESRTGSGSAYQLRVASCGDGYHKGKPHQTHSKTSSAGSGAILTKTQRAPHGTKAQRAPHVIDEVSSAFEISSGFDIDTWSCDYEEFDLGSDYYSREARSRSPSHSSRSTTKVKNLSFPAARNGKGQDAYQEPNTPTHYIVDQEKLKKKCPPDPPEQVFPNARSKRTSTIQEGSITSQVGRMKRFSSPLSMLFDTVTQTVSSPVHSHPQSFPAVTPEETDSAFDPPAESSRSNEEDNALEGLHFKDEASGSSSSTGFSDSPWLFEKVEESLGPRSASADMESLSGRSNLSTKSPSHRSRTGGSQATTRSVGSKRSRPSSFEASLAPRTLEYDLRRLEKQLEALDAELESTSSADFAGGTNTIRPAKTLAFSQSDAAKGNVGQKKLVVVAPPGTLGVILSNRKHGEGIIVAQIRQFSALHQRLSPGDLLIGVDDDDVTSMTVSEITELMASRADRERRLTVITSVADRQGRM